MQCKKFEYLIIESSERDLTDGEQLRLQEHCSQCNDCAHFKESLEEIRFSLKHTAPPSLSSDLDKKTKHLFMLEIDRKKFSPGKEEIPFRPPVPIYIWAAVALLTLLTSLLLFPELMTLNSDQPISLRTIALLTVILQNTVMLFFTPLIIRRYKSMQRFSDLYNLELS
ncbi:MAG TPA: hypothetical protein ENN58_04240 [bacterium]|nr:hypothetical protein [bacterium]